MFRLPQVPLRRGMTLLEIIVVISIITSLCVMAAGMFPGPIQYFRARRTMETLLWDFRKVQQRARSRGHSSNTGGPASTDPAAFGVKFYRGTMVWNGAALAKNDDGYSYIAFGPAAQVPPDDLSTLNASQTPLVVNMDASLIPVADGAPDAPARGLPIQVVFTRDVLTGLGDIVPDDASAAGCAACPRNHLDFRLLNNDGYFRIQFENQRFIGLRYVPMGGN